MQHQVQIRIFFLNLIQLIGKLCQRTAFVLFIHQIDADQKIMNIVRIKFILDMIADIKRVI